MRSREETEQETAAGQASTCTAQRKRSVQGLGGFVLFLLFLNTCDLDRPTSHLTRGEGNLTFNLYDLSVAMSFKSELARNGKK